MELKLFSGIKTVILKILLCWLQPSLVSYCWVSQAQQESVFPAELISEGFYFIGEIQMKKHLALLDKKAYLFSTKYFVDYNEIKSQLYEAFAEALNDFDENKSKFITYLFSKINTVEERIRHRRFHSKKSGYKRIRFTQVAYTTPEEKRKYFIAPCGNGHEGSREDKSRDTASVKEYYNTSVSNGHLDRSFFETFCEQLYFQESMEKELSEDARKVINWIFSNQFNAYKKTYKQITLSEIKERLKAIWDNSKVNSVINEIRSWWLCYQ